MTPRRTRTLPAGVYLDRKSGRYIAKLRLGGVMSKALTFDSIADAVEHLDALRAAFAESTAPVRSKGTTLGEWLEDWIKVRRASGRYRDVDGDEKLLARYVGDELRATPLRELRSRTMRSWLYDLSNRPAQSGGGRGKTAPGRPIARQTVANALNLLRAALHDAVDAGKMASNPLVGLRPPRLAPTTIEHTGYLASEQIAALLATSAPERHRLIWTVAIYTGLRAGELWGLRWEDVLLEGSRPELIVRHSYDRAPKGGRVRRVPLLAQARAALLRWRDMQGARSIAGLVWPARRRRGDALGVQRCHHRGYDAEWSTWARRAGITMPLKQARHTCGSHLLMGTWGPPMPMRAVQAWLGHSSVTTTEDFYAAYSEDSLHGYRAAIDSSAGSSAAKPGRKAKKPRT